MKSNEKLIVIEVLEGGDVGPHFFPEDRKTISVGRDQANDIVLSAVGVSRRHAEFNFRGDMCFLHDLGSLNGVRLIRGSSKAASEIRSCEVAVKTGDIFEIGEARLKISITDASATDLLDSINEDDSTELLIPGVPVQGSSSAAALLRNANADTKDSEAIPEGVEPDAVDLFSKLSERNEVFFHPLPFYFLSYEVQEKIGEGGMGDVYLASERCATEPRAQLAIKFLRQNRALSVEDRARFRREMEISVRLKHPSIIDCTDCGDDEGRLFIVMPYCSGGNLAQLLERAGKLTLRRGLRLLDRLLAGVEHAHNAGIVHRDLKPSNILLARDGASKYVPKISDFGLAKSYLLAGKSGMTVDGAVGGSWGYMPREQLTNFRFVSPQSDVWSLGVILYECLTKELPRPRPSGMDPVRIILESKLVPIDRLLPDIPKRIASFIAKALAIDVADRYKDAAQMRKALRVAANGEGIDL